MKRIRVGLVRSWLLLAVVLATSLTACTASSGGHSSSSAKTSAGPLITIKSFHFTMPASVQANQKVLVRNEDGVAHTVTSTHGKGFDVKVGAHASATFTAPAQSGRYAVVCTYHPYMKATLVVR